MSEIDIQRRHGLGLEDARRLAEEIAGGLKREFGLTWRWDGQALRFRRDGVEGALTVSEDAMRIHARLGWLLALARPRIEREIHTRLDRALGPVPPPGGHGRA